MRENSRLMAAFGAGLGLSYFLDPGRGARRRARVRDAVVHGMHVSRRALSTTSRDAMHRSYGTVVSIRNRWRHEEVPDDILVERVRARLGRVVSHPHPVEVSASNGTVTLGGPILARDVPRLLEVVAHVRGVRDVVNRLAVHESAGNVPALQGGRTPAGERLDVMQTHWAPTTRALMCTCGGALTMLGLLRRGAAGAIAAAGGAVLMGRAAANVPINRLTGIGSRRRALDIQKTITIDASPEAVFGYWSRYENFPRFMSRVLDVRPSERRPNQAHWKVAGPAGVPVEFDAEITRMVENREIAWKTLPGAVVAHAGIVRFDPTPDGRTRVHIRMSYNPPAGWVGHGVAAAFGADPKGSMDEDLARMKTLIETGHAPHDAARRSAG